MLATGKPIRLASVFVAVTLFILCSPTEAWYKQAAGPSYYSVGRASGLLSGIRRSPYIRRSERESALESAETLENDVDSGLGNRINLILKNTGVCVKRLSPDMQSCERVDGGASVYRCKADVFLLLHSQDCLND